MKPLITSLVVSLVVSIAVVVLVAGHSAPKAGGIAASAAPFAPCENHGGIISCNYIQVMRQATTTPCNITSPLNATTTLNYAEVHIVTASSTATQWDIAESPNAYATTTAIDSPYLVAAGAQADILASTSPAAGAVTIFPPGSHLVIGVRQGISSGDTTGAGFVPVGKCSAKFTEVN